MYRTSMLAVCVLLFTACGGGPTTTTTTAPRPSSVRPTTEAPHTTSVSPQPHDEEMATPVEPDPGTIESDFAGRIGQACDAQHACQAGAICSDVATTESRLEPADTSPCEGEDCPLHVTYCDLPTARRTLSAEEALLVFSSSDAHYAVIDGAVETEDAPVSETPPPRVLGPDGTTIVIGRAATQSESRGIARALTGRALRILTSAGATCEGTLGARWLVERTDDGGDTDQEEAWEAEDAGREVEWQHAAILRTMLVRTGSCDRPMFARAATLPPVTVVAPDVVVPHDVQGAARNAFDRLAPARLLSATFGEGEEDGPWWGEREPEVRRFVLAGVARVVVSAWGDPCDGFPAALTVVFREDAAGALTVESMSTVGSYFHHALDLDGDGRIELIGTRTPGPHYGDLRLVSPTLSTSSAVERTGVSC